MTRSITTTSSSKSTSPVRLRRSQRLLTTTQRCQVDASSSCCMDDNDTTTTNSTTSSDSGNDLGKASLKRTRASSYKRKGRDGVASEPDAQDVTERSEAEHRPPKKKKGRTTSSRNIDLPSEDNIVTTTEAAPPNDVASIVVTQEEEESHNGGAATLPRTMEFQILNNNNNSSSIRYVLGIDEAGRGPLAGPVVAAAICFPHNNNDDDPPITTIAGIVDSKKITSEATRESLYEQLISIPNIVWAVAVIDAPTIDSINILQATLLGMKLAAQVAIGQQPQPTEQTTIVTQASTNHTGCYVVLGDNGSIYSNRNQSMDHNDDDTSEATNEKDNTKCDKNECYALVDGNRIPKDMPCASQAVIKGDGKEYCIAAASILAKVTRDRLMHEYDKMYPAYGLSQHKGYPTRQHMASIQQYGATPIHRKTFAPLKHMDL